jgi:hypothetical protein
MFCAMNPDVFQNIAPLRSLLVNRVPIF